MSFNQEVKDFLGAAQAGQKIMGATTDEQYKAIKQKYLEAQTKTIEDKNDDEVGQDLDRQIKRATIARSNAAASASNSASAYRNAQIKALNTPPPPDPIYGGVRSTMDNPTAAVPAPAVGGPAVASSPAIAPPAAIPAVPADDTDATGSYSAGGMVKKYADGGAVADDDEELPAPPAAAPQAVPVDGSADTPQQAADEGEAEGGANDASMDTDFSSRGRGTPQFSPAAGVDGVKAGLNYGAKALGLHQNGAVPDPGRARSAHAWATGAHAAPVEDMDKIKAAVDPDNKLGESARNLAAIGAVYQYKMNKGDTDGAARAAFQMIQHYRVASQRYAVIAAHAAETGNLDVATHAAMKAYANVPDGQDFKIEKTADGNLAYTLTGADGKVIHQGIEPPSKLAATAMGFAQGGFDSTLLAAAGQPQPKAAVDPNATPMKSADKKTALKQVDDAYTEQNPDDAKTGAPKYAPDDALAIKGAAFRISAHTQNSRLLPGEAVQAATKIADPTALDKSGFTTKKADGGYKVTFPGKEAVFVPEATFATLIGKRNEKLQAQKKIDDAAKAAAAKPGLLSDVKKATAGYGADLSANAPKTVFPGGTNQAIPAPPPTPPEVRTEKPYVPFLAGGR